MDLWTNLNGASFEALSAACAATSLCLESLAEAAKAVASAFSPSLELIRDFMQTMLEPKDSLLETLLEDCWEYVPPRVRHLALHHPKARVRNKNWSRIWKIRKEYMQCKR